MTHPKVTVDRVRQILKKRGEKLTDEQIKQLLAFLRKLSDESIG